MLEPTVSPFLYICPALATGPYCTISHLTAPFCPPGLGSGRWSVPEGCGELPGGRPPGLRSSGPEGGQHPYAPEWDLLIWGCHWCAVRVPGAQCQHHRSAHSWWDTTGLRAMCSHMFIMWKQWAKTYLALSNTHFIAIYVLRWLKLFNHRWRVSWKVELGC